MKNELIKECENWFDEMSKKLEETKKVGMILMATDLKGTWCAFAATKKQIKEILIQILHDEECKNIILEIIAEKQNSKTDKIDGCKKSKK